MTRKTSTIAYHKIKANGLLSKRRQEVYEALYHHGPLTANDLVRKMKQQYAGFNQTGWNARFCELERMGVIAEVGKKKDDVSGHDCIVWDVTGNLPKPLNKPPSRKEIRKKLTAKIVELESMMNDTLRPHFMEMCELVGLL